MTYQPLRSFLEQFHPISDAEFASLLNMLVPLKLKKKEFLLSHGQMEENVYFVVSGLIHQFFYRGKEMISTDFYNPGSFTGGVISFLSGKPSYYYLQAIEPCELISLSKTNLERLYQADRKWQQLARLLLTNYLIKQENEIMNTIRLTMRERYVQFAKDFPDLLEKVPQRRIASYLNIKPETFSRLKPLLKNG